MFVPVSEPRCFVDYSDHQFAATVVSRLCFTQPVEKMTPCALVVTFAHVFKDKPDSKRYEWDITTVKKILKDETYIGNTVHYRQTKLSYKSNAECHRNGPVGP